MEKAMPVDRTPECVRAVLDKPGKYEFRNNGLLFFIEVDEKGHVYQLKPRSLVRDGILSRSGWADSASTGKVTPLHSDDRSKACQ
jgi:hypothetical protein